MYKITKICDLPLFGFAPVELPDKVIHHLARKVDWKDVVERYRPHFLGFPSCSYVGFK
jgi:hypothetical protein